MCESSEMYWLSWLKLRLALNMMWVFEVPFLAMLTISVIMTSLSRLFGEFSINFKVISVSSSRTVFYNLVRRFRFISHVSLVLLYRSP